MTQLKKARSGIVTPEMKAVAHEEHVDIDWLREQVARGRVVIPANPRHDGLAPCGIGEVPVVWAGHWEDQPFVIIRDPGADHQTGVGQFGPVIIA